MEYKEYFSCSKESAIRMVTRLEKSIRGITKDFLKIVIVCIGTDRSTGDSFGPLSGTFLSEKFEDHFRVTSMPVHILGTLENPVHASNLKDVIDNIDDKSLVIAIDASLGEPKLVGDLCIMNGGINPGSSVGKELPSVGDISITGCVNMNCGHLNPLILQHTNLSLVYRMAKQVEHCMTSALINIFTETNE